MKKTCKGCKAYWIYTPEPFCQLKYRQINGVPQEECSKPLTEKKFNTELMNMKRKEL